MSTPSKASPALELYPTDPDLPHIYNAQTDPPNMPEAMGANGSGNDSRSMHYRCNPPSPALAEGYMHSPIIPQQASSMHMAPAPYPVYQQATQPLHPMPQQSHVVNGQEPHSKRKRGREEDAYPQADAAPDGAGNKLKSSNGSIVKTYEAPIVRQTKRAKKSHESSASNSSSSGTAQSLQTAADSVNPAPAPSNRLDTSQNEATQSKFNSILTLNKYVKVATKLDLAKCRERNAKIEWTGLPDGVPEDPEDIALFIDYFELCMFDNAGFVDNLNEFAPGRGYRNALFDGEIDREEFRLVATDMVDKLIALHTEGKGTKNRRSSDPTNETKWNYERFWTWLQRYALSCKAVKEDKCLVKDLINRPQDAERLLLLAPQRALDAKLRHLKSNNTRRITMREAKVNKEMTTKDSTAPVEPTMKLAPLPGVVLPRGLNFNIERAQTGSSGGKEKAPVPMDLDVEYGNVMQDFDAPNHQALDKIPGFQWDWTVKTNAMSDPAIHDSAIPANGASGSSTQLLDQGYEQVLEGFDEETVDLTPANPIGKGAQEWSSYGIDPRPDLRSAFMMGSNGPVLRNSEETSESVQKSHHIDETEIQHSEVPSTSGHAANMYASGGDFSAMPNNQTSEWISSTGNSAPIDMSANDYFNARSMYHGFTDASSPFGTGEPSRAVVGVTQGHAGEVSSGIQSQDRHRRTAVGTQYLIKDRLAKARLRSANTAIFPPM